MSSLLCNPAVSPFLVEVVLHGGGSSGSGGGIVGGSGTSSKRVGDGRDRAVVSWPRPLLAGLACLGAHADLGQRELLLVSFSDTGRYHFFYFFFKWLTREAFNGAFERCDFSDVSAGVFSDEGTGWG